MKRTVNIYTIILTFVFLIWILVPLFNDIFQFYSEPSVSKRENRIMVRRPIVNITLLDPYPKAYENFFTDHFVFRQPLLQTHSLINFIYFARSPVPDQVDIGKNGWLYYGLKDREIYQGKKSLTIDTVRKIVRALHNRSVYYKGKGIHFYFCFAPMKQEIYPEYLPNNYFRSQSGTQTDHLIAAIRKDGDIPFIDLKSDLIAAKHYGQLYQKTDHHWNFLGAFYAYSAIIERIKKDFPVLKPMSESDVNFKMDTMDGGTLANMIGFAPRLKENLYIAFIKSPRAKPGTKAGYPPPYWFAYKDDYEVVRVTSDPTMPKLFVIRDSFFSLPMFFLQENFRKTVVIWDAWLYGPNKDLVEKEKPDIVLLMIYEQNIENILIVPSD